MPLHCTRRSTVLSSVLECAMGAKQSTSTSTSVNRDADTDVVVDDWKWLLWDSAFATEYLHPELGAGWTAVLLEACCVRAKDQRAFLPAVKVLTLSPLSMGGLVSKVTHISTSGGAASRGSLSLIKWLRERGCPWDGSSWMCSAAASGGHLGVLKYLHENGCPWDEWTCSYAAEGGHLAMLKYAHENGCPWDKGTCAEAAIGGRLAVLKYAHDNGCPWDEGTCSGAAERGHLDVLKYAHENGCPWDESDCRFYAVAEGHAHVIAWIDSLLASKPCGSDAKTWRCQVDAAVVSPRLH